MPSGNHETWFDDAAGPLVRPYAATNGRTEPSRELDLVSRIVATGYVPENLDLQHTEVLQLCHPDQSAEVAEIAGRVRLPIMVTKVLLCDLIECGAAALADASLHDDASNLAVLQEVLKGLHAL